MCIRDRVEGGESGSAVDLKDIDDSLMLSAINYESFEMPPIGQLPAASIEEMTRWIKSGAPWPEDQSIKVAIEDGGGEEGGIIPPEINDETRAFWSFQPPKRPGVPDVEDVGWARDPIDRFVLCLLYTSPSPRDATLSRMPSSA